jgi:hypothetical protein
VTACKTSAFTTTSSGRDPCLSPPVPVTPVRPVMPPREDVARPPPVAIRERKTARVEALLVDRLFVDARLYIHALLAKNGGCLMVVVMMLDDLTVDDRRPDVGFSFRIGWPIEIRGRGRDQRGT